MLRGLGLGSAAARNAVRANARRANSTLASFATLDPNELSGAHPHTMRNLVQGEWAETAEHLEVPDPLTGETFVRVPTLSSDAELAPFVESLRGVSASGLHNPLKNVERYNLYGAVSARAAAMLGEAPVADFFARLVQRTSPKSYAQALGEINITRTFLQNFSGDQVRFLARGFSVPGDHLGQQSHGYRFPFGPVAIITPFNFPVEIPVLQLMGALYMGNKPLLHVDARVAVAMEQFLRLLHAAGMPADDVDFCNGNGAAVNDILLRGRPRNTLFTGSNAVAEKLTADLRGRIRVEDAGFDWKILGPDVGDVDYVAWQCDQDAYACSGQKCSAQSILFMHSNWVQAGLEDKIKQRAALRSLDDLTIGPVLSWSTERMFDHVDKLLAIPGARLAFGREPLQNHTIPDRYGAIEPTAVFVPLKEISSEAHFDLATTEVFGPVQVITEYGDGDLDAVLEVCERMENHLTAAIVSNDQHFVDHVSGRTINGTTYAGRRARTTGAPQNHWFGPSGDPRGAGIGTREAIQVTWSSHREIIRDVGPAPAEVPPRPT